MNINVISVREKTEYLERVIEYFQKTWASENSLMVYDDSIRSSISARKPLPQWYVLVKDDEIIGCAGLITNDFISRMDLYPWICALFIDETHRGNGYAKLLLDKAMDDARSFGFLNAYLCTDHLRYYERYGFSYLGIGYHPWGESSRIYEIEL